MSCTKDFSKNKIIFIPFGTQLFKYNFTQWHSVPIIQFEKYQALLVQLETESSQKLNFILDTGATRNQIIHSKGFSEKDAELKEYGLASERLTSKFKTNAGIISIDFDKIDSLCRSVSSDSVIKKIDGFLGYRFFNNHVVFVNLETQRVYFIEKEKLS